jgi:hypothetical protein
VSPAAGKFDAAIDVPIQFAATLTKERMERVVQSKDRSIAIRRNLQYRNQLDVICMPAPTRAGCAIHTRRRR